MVRRKRSFEYEEEQTTVGAHDDLPPNDFEADYEEEQDHSDDNYESEYDVSDFDDVVDDYE